VEEEEEEEEGGLLKNGACSDRFQAPATHPRGPMEALARSTLLPCLE
jgi:hypothetical protein